MGNREVAFKSAFAVCRDALGASERNCQVQGSPATFKRSSPFLIFFYEERVKLL